MVEDIDPHIIGITESWANIDITDTELGTLKWHNSAGVHTWFAVAQQVLILI